MAANPLGQGAQDASIAIAGELQMRSLGEDRDAAGARLVGLSFGHLDTAQLVLLGRDLLADTKLDGVEAFATLSRDGSVASLRFAPGTSPIAGHLFTALVRELAITVPAGHADRWTVVEDAPNGRARATYQVVAQPRADLIALARHRESYVTLSAFPHHADAPQEIRAVGHLVLDASGAILELEDHDHLSIDGGGNARLDADHDFILERVTTRTLAATERAPAQLAALSKVPEADVATRMLEQQAAGLTLPELRLAIENFALTGVTLRGDTWLVRAVAFATLHPETCAQVAAIVDDPRIGTRGMGMVLDLLASTGTPQAQAALREALTSPRVGALRPEARAMLITRAAYLDHPDADTVALMRSLASGDGADGDAARVALGDVTRKLAATGDADEVARAAELATDLRAELADAPAGRARLVALVALGAARQPDDRATLERWSHDGEPAERAAATAALARFAPTGKDTP